MSIELLQKRFGVMGARLRHTGVPFAGAPRVDVDGSTFVLRFPGGSPVGVDVVDVRGRHLLLLVRDDGDKSKFLCGHDERHWFVAAVPESARGVTGVSTAMAALRPDDVRGRYVRQGEWFFVPAPALDPPPLLVLRKEPLSRGVGSTPHVLAEAYRQGGETVYVRRDGGGVRSADEFERLSRDERRQHGWDVMVRDAEVYARGAVRHPDHATVVLNGWHRVFMNTEQSARAMRHVAFLD